MHTIGTRRFIGLCCVFLYVNLLLAGAGGAQTFFTDVTERLDVLQIPARSTTFGDYNNDGWPDLFCTEDFDTHGKRPPARITLILNEGHGRFVDFTSLSIQAEISSELKGGGAIFGDYDNDGDLDLFVPVGAQRPNQRAWSMLLRNDRGIFRDVASQAGLTEKLPTDNAIWLDYNRDGYIDLYTGNVVSAGGRDLTVRNRLYRNDGDGTFTDVTREVHLDVQLTPYGGSNGGMSAGDFNDDGWPDIYVGVWQSPNRLFLNDGQGGFQDATTHEIDDPGEAYGIAVGDIDNDGDLDIFQAAGGGAGGYGDFRSLMLLNIGEGQFLDATQGVGIFGLEEAQTLGVGLGDIDNDGDLDLMVAYPHRLFLNNGDGTFTDQTILSGIEAAGMTVSWGDYDLDGFLDVWFGSSAAYWGSGVNAWRLYHNKGNDNHWLRVEVVGVESNRSGIGARLIATSGELWQMREILGDWVITRTKWWSISVWESAPGWIRWRSAGRRAKWIC